jgi:aspartyl-tRNA(Asn)/glutamyl-tRNA(Gln) amidotransferase subunit C
MVIIMDLQTFNNTAELGKLAFSDEERGELLADVTEIIGIMDSIRELDITYDPILDNKNVYLPDLRTDGAEPSFDTAKILSNAKQSENCFVVPKVIE